MVGLLLGPLWTGADLRPSARFNGQPAVAISINFSLHKGQQCSAQACLETYLHAVLHHMLPHADVNQTSMSVFPQHYTNLALMPQVCQAGLASTVFGPEFLTCFLVSIHSLLAGCSLFLGGLQGLCGRPDASYGVCAACHKVPPRQEAHAPDTACTSQVRLSGPVAALHADWIMLGHLQQLRC